MNAFYFSLKFIHLFNESNVVLLKATGALSHMCYIVHSSKTKYHDPLFVKYHFMLTVSGKETLFLQQYTLWD